MIRNILRVSVALLIGGLMNPFSVNAQQQAQFSLSHLYLDFLNPALTALEANNLTIGARNQWVNLEGAPVTYTAGASYKLKTENFLNQTGLGLYAQADELGIFSNRNVSLQASHPFKLLGQHVVVGGMYQFGKLFADFDQVNPQDPNDPVLTEGFSYFRSAYSLGVHVYNKRYAFSLSNVDGLNQQENTGFPELTNHLFANLMLKLNQGKRVEWRPGILYQTNLEPEVRSVNTASIYVSALLKNDFLFGLSSRLAESITAYAQIPIIKGLSAAYAYDYGLNNLTNRFSGSHEIWLRFTFEAGTNKPYTHPRNFFGP